MINLDSILKRHYFSNKGPHSQSYGFSSSCVWLWELDHKEGWASKSWCFWTVVLEKTLESPLACKEIQLVNPKVISPEYSLEGLIKVKVVQWCPTLCDPMDYTVHAILQARPEILEWVGVSFSRGSSQSRGQTQIAYTAGGFFTSWATREACWSWSSNTLATWSKSWVIRKDPDAEKDWRQEEKVTTDHKMVEWCHQFNGHDFEWAPGDGEGRESLMCCSPCSCKKSDVTERQQQQQMVMKVSGKLRESKTMPFTFDYKHDKKF